MTLSPNINSREFDKFRASPKTGNTLVAVDNEDGVTINNQINGPYGEQITSKITAVISGSAIYGFIPSNFRSFSSLGGSTGVDVNLMYASSGTQSGGYGAVRSFRSTNYKEGNGSLIRFGAKFTSSSTGSNSFAGAYNTGNDFGFGYKDTTFGIWHSYGGIIETKRLTLNTAASGAESATLVLDGTSYTIPLTAATTQVNAREIATYLMANSTIVEAWQVNNTVEINFLADGNKTGSFSYSSTTSTGTITSLVEGVLKTTDFVPMTDWIGDNVQSWIDPSKGMAYAINFQNGFGDISFYVHDKDQDLFLLAHTIEWHNRYIVTNVVNPNMKLGCYAFNTQATTTARVDLAYITGFIVGEFLRTRNPRAFSNTKSIATTETNIFTVRCKNIYNGNINQSEIEPVHLTMSNDGAKTAIFNLRTGSTITSYNFQNTGTNLLSETDVTATTVAGGNIIASFAVAKGQTLSVDLSEYKIRIPPTLTMTMTGYMTSGAASDLSASITWYEDI